MKKEMQNLQRVKMTDNDLKRFLHSSNIFEMSFDKLNYYFNGFYEFLMKDAVYPHLFSQKSN